MPPSITFDTVLALAQQLAPVDQARLAATLTAAVQHAAAPAGFPEVAPLVRELLPGMTVDAMVVPPSGTPDDAVAMVQAWLDEDDAGEAEGSEAWAEVLRSLDANRFSTRPLFPELGPA